MIKKLYKIPISVLVVIYTKQSSVLLLHRADRKNYWQSVTGSIEGQETLLETAKREVYEETGINTDMYSLQDWNLNHSMKYISIGDIVMNQILRIILSTYLGCKFLQKLL